MTPSKKIQIKLIKSGIGRIKKHQKMKKIEND